MPCTHHNSLQVKMHHSPQPGGETHTISLYISCTACGAPMQILCWESLDPTATELKLQMRTLPAARPASKGVMDYPGTPSETIELDKYGIRAKLFMGDEAGPLTKNEVDTLQKQMDTVREDTFGHVTDEQVAAWKRDMGTPPTDEELSKASQIYFKPGIKPEGEQQFTKYTNHGIQEFPRTPDESFPKTTDNGNE